MASLAGLTGKTTRLRAKRLARRVLLLAVSAVAALLAQMTCGRRGFTLGTPLSAALVEQLAGQAWRSAARCSGPTGGGPA